MLLVVAFIGLQWQAHHSPDPGAATSRVVS